MVLAGQVIRPVVVLVRPGRTRGFVPKVNRGIALLARAVAMIAVGGYRSGRSIGPVVGRLILRLDGAIGCGYMIRRYAVRRILVGEGWDYTRGIVIALPGQIFIKLVVQMMGAGRCRVRVEIIPEYVRQGRIR